MQIVKDSDGSFIVARYFRHKRPHHVSSEPSDFERGVSIFDLEAKRWYTILKDDERRTYVGDLVVDKVWFVNMSGILWFGGDMVRPLIVYNPIENTKKTIEGTILDHYMGYEIPNIAMVVDSMTRKYKVFVMRGARCIYILPMNPEVPYMIVYNSATDKVIKPPDLPGSFLFEICLCIVAHQNKLYTLTTLVPHEHRVCCYNISQDAWEDVGMCYHGRVLYFPQLIVSGNRLFLVTWSLELEKDFWQRSERDWQLEGSEFMIPERNHVRIFGMTNAAVLQIFGPKSGEEINEFKHSKVNAFIFGNSVVLMTRKTGVLITYDMETHLLDSLPPNPSRPPDDEGYFCQAKQTNLVLPTRRW